MNGVNFVAQGFVDTQPESLNWQIANPFALVWEGSGREYAASRGALIGKMTLWRPASFRWA
jgi:hypothetical protein